MTLTGPGGSGKTRLALRVAERSVPELADQVGWVELASLADERLVASEACSSLEVRLAAGQSPRDVLLSRLQSARWLLVLDNCEHLLEACSNLVAVALEQCPNLKFLVTSRQALGAPGEVHWPVPPLAVPDGNVTRKRNVGQAMESAAVQLFADRARAAAPDFELTPENVSAVVQLCGRLEGIPLAIELAAARVKVLSVEQIVDRLDNCLDLLSRPERNVESPHSTMQAALEWSHDMLSEPQRVLFRRLGAFGGGADLDACEAVCGGEPLERTAIIDLLTDLFEKSLILVEKTESIIRYRLLEPVRHFAGRKLIGSGESAIVRSRHAAYYLEQARVNEPELRGPRRADALRRLERDLDNLRRAWEFADESSDEETLAGLARTLFWFWNFSGRFIEGRERSEGALERSTDSGEARPELRYSAGALAWMQGDHSVARNRLEECIAISRDSQKVELTAIAMRELAGVYLARGDFRRSVQLYELSVTALKESGNAWDLGLALLMLADAREGGGDATGGLPLRKEALRLFRETGDPWGLSLVQFSLGVAAARAGDLAKAGEFGRDALSLQRTVGDDWNIGQVLVLLGELEERAGKWDRAGDYLFEGIESFRSVGDRMSLVFVLSRLGEIERRRGRTLRAVRIAGAAHAQSESLAGSYPYALATEAERQRSEEALRRAAGQAAFVEEWARGRAMSLDAAVEFALDVPGGRAPAVRGVAEEGALQIFALGPPIVFLRRRRLRAADWTYALPRDLLFYLLVHGPRTKEQIGLEFWPNASGEQLKGRFRTTLYQLRRALGGAEWVLYRNGRYEFNRELGHWFDVEVFEADLDKAASLLDSDHAGAAACLQEAVDLYRGEFLEGEEGAPWAATYRETLRRGYREALLMLGGIHASAGSHGIAAGIFRRAIELDNLDESARRELAKALDRSGDRAAALRQLDDLATQLREELDAEPSTETLALRADLERDRGA